MKDRLTSRTTTSAFQTFLDLPVPFAAGDDVAIVPAHDQVAARQELQMLVELVARSFVLMRVGVEDVQGIALHVGTSVAPD